ncbi:hypothetical protein BpHYR1_002482 [Brachionus plicatilis]|uniref:Uncharacterized protein n=1 Tax=Brachionus plicatilis TaxID=10195 RepID=A0A3M7QH88_BRAPC|nr:hypothetical protein BpHYR1_002482 [Brachionus plicatilis]
MNFFDYLLMKILFSGNYSFNSSSSGTTAVFFFFIKKYETPPIIDNPATPPTDAPIITPTLVRALSVVLFDTSGVVIDSVRFGTELDDVVDVSVVSVLSFIP